MIPFDRGQNDGLFSGLPINGIDHQSGKAMTWNMKLWNGFLNHHQTACFVVSGPPP